MKRMTGIGHKAVVEGAWEDCRETQGAKVVRRPLAINSKHLTRVYVQVIAGVLELPIQGSVTEIRQLIDDIIQALSSCH